MVANYMGNLISCVAFLLRQQLQGSWSSGSRQTLYSPLVSLPQVMESVVPHVQWPQTLSSWPPPYSGCHEVALALSSGNAPQAWHPFSVGFSRRTVVSNVKIQGKRCAMSISTSHLPHVCRRRTPHAALLAHQPGIFSLYYPTWGQLTWTACLIFLSLVPKTIWSQINESPISLKVHNLMFSVRSVRKPGNDSLMLNPHLSYVSFFLRQAVLVESLIPFPSCLLIGCSAILLG
jgi:hypothetical protein